MITWVKAVIETTINNPVMITFRMEDRLCLAGILVINSIISRIKAGVKDRGQPAPQLLIVSE
jgi:hypothetical protein